MAYTAEQLRALSGQEDYASAPVGGSYYDALAMGKDGNFYLTHYSAPKSERPDPTALGTSVTVPVLKMRRQFQRWSDADNAYDIKSVEYDASTPTVATTHGDMSEKQAKAQGAKVSIILYVLVNGKIAKLKVSGSSLYNPEDTENLRLYTYLQSFDEGETLATFETNIKSVTRTYTNKEGVEASTVDMAFSRGKEVADLTAIGDALTAITTALPENDARDLKYLGSSKPKTQAPSAYPAEEINPDDVPF